MLSVEICTKDGLIKNDDTYKDNTAKGDDVVTGYLKLRYPVNSIHFTHKKVLFNKFVTIGRGKERSNRQKQRVPRSSSLYSKGFGEESRRMRRNFKKKIGIIS